LVGDDDPIVIRCSHDGYDRLRGSPRHTRSWTLTEQSLTVEDEISGDFRSAAARFHLHPAVEIEDTTIDGDDGIVAILRLPLGQTVRMKFGAGPVKREPSTWHPEFGRSVPSVCLVQPFRGATARTLISWSGV
jgi:uncharacterized heparinase superfamily protein